MSLSGSRKNARESVSGVYIKFNNNPRAHGRVGDCVIRALSKALRKSWDEIYWDLCDMGHDAGDWGSSNAVWSAYLHDNGFTRHAIPAEYAGWYTVEDFAEDHPHGTYILGIDGHVVCVKDGAYFDSWNSGAELPIFFWAKN